MTTNIMLAVGGNWFGVAWYWYALVLIALVLQSGFVLIRERQVGIVIKRFCRQVAAARTSARARRRGGVPSGNWWDWRWLIDFIHSAIFVDDLVALKKLKN